MENVLTMFVIVHQIILENFVNSLLVKMHVLWKENATILHKNVNAK